MNTDSKDFKYQSVLSDMTKVLAKMYISQPGIKDFDEAQSVHS